MQPDDFLRLCLFQPGVDRLASVARAQPIRLARFVSYAAYFTFLFGLVKDAISDGTALLGAEGVISAAVMLIAPPIIQSTISAGRIMRVNPLLRIIRPLLLIEATIALALMLPSLMIVGAAGVPLLAHPLTLLFVASSFYLAICDAPPTRRLQTSF